MLQPDAHEQARNNNVVTKIVEIAENFRLKYS
ncbi:hypothetical protein [Beggiatoa leptomitoformis]